MLLSEAKQILENHGFQIELNEVKLNTQTVTFEFNKNFLEEIGIKNSFQLYKKLNCITEKIYWKDDFYKIYAEDIPVEKAKKWFDEVYDKDEWNYALSQIFVPSNAKHEQIEIMNGNSKPPQWNLVNSSIAKGTDRWVNLAYYTKGMKYETIETLFRVFEKFEGRDSTYHEDEPYISAMFPMTGLKNLITKINTMYPKFSSRLRVFSDYNMTKDITAKYVGGNK